jgi:hypothetical protein
MKINQHIDIELRGKGTWVQSHYTGKRYPYQAAIWNNRVEGPEYLVFGLTLYEGPTHMCYGIDYFKPKELLEKQDSLGHRLFYFDAGGNGRPIFCTTRELERVFKELELI